MTVCLIVQIFETNNNGTSISANCFARTLVEHGHTVRVVALGDPQKSGFSPETGIYMYYVPEMWIPLITWIAGKNLMRFAQPDRKTLTEAITGCDAVHLYQAWPLESTAAKIAKKLGIPVVAAFHMQPENVTYNVGMGRLSFMATFTYFLLRVLFYRRFDHVHCPSRMIATELRAHNYKMRLHVISNGVHPSFFPAPPKRPFDDGMFHILMVGRLAPEKRQDVLIRAMMRSQNSGRIQLHFAGQGPSAAKLAKLARNLPNPPQFGFYSREELLELMRACDLYVHTSDIEIEGLGCLEAIAAGLVPVISDSRRSATSQFALFEQSLFKAGDPDDLARQIDYWFNNRDQMESARASYAKLADVYALDSSVRQMERVYAAIKTKERGNVYFKGRLSRVFCMIFTSIAVPVLFLYTRLFMGVRVRGSTNLWKVRGALTVCNHVHMLDSALVGIVLFPRKAVFPTIGQNLNTLFPGVLVHALGGVPIPEKMSDMPYFFDEMEFKLRQGKVVHFFPEGQLVPYGTTLRGFKRGAFRLAAKAHVPVVPITIRFAEPKGLYRLIRRKPMMRMTVHEPIRPVSLDERQDERIRQTMVQERMDLAIRTSF